MTTAASNDCLRCPGGKTPVDQHDLAGDIGRGVRGQINDRAVQIVRAPGEGELGADEHAVIKTLIFEDEAANPLIVLMHGDMEVSTKTLARILGAKSINPCQPQTAFRHTGYQTGGTSPLGLKKELPVYMEETLLELETILINGGKKGLFGCWTFRLSGATDPKPPLGVPAPWVLGVAVPNSRTV